LGKRADFIDRLAQRIGPVKSTSTQIRTFDFSFPRKDMQLRVEVDGEEVTVRASRNGFSEQRKSAFIRELASEGFIPDAHRWYFAQDGDGFGRRVRWVIDRSILETEEEVRARSGRLTLGLFSGTLAATALLMGLLFTGNLGPFRVESALPAHAASSGMVTRDFSG
jgi:hypothetical protein